MLKKKNHIGRPSNKEIRARKNKKMFIAAISIVFVLLVVGMFETGSLSKLMGNSVTEYYCEDGYKLKGDKCTKTVSIKAYRIGDANQDGKININDVTTIQRYLAEFITFDNYQMVLADVDQDGKVNITDTTILQKYLSGSFSGSMASEHYIGQGICPKNYGGAGNRCYTDITVDAKIKKEYTEYKIGDMITYHEIDFQVIKDSNKNDSMITMIKLNPISSTEIMSLGDYSTLLSNIDGMVSSGKFEYGGDYATNRIKTIVDTWAKTNSLLASSNDKVRLIYEDELRENLKYNIYGVANIGYVDGLENSLIKWEENPYWVLSTETYMGKYEFVPAGTTGQGSSGDGAYIRPVIEFSKSNLGE